MYFRWVQEVRSFRRAFFDIVLMGKNSMFFRCTLFDAINIVYMNFFQYNFNRKKVDVVLMCFFLLNFRRLKIGVVLIYTAMLFSW